MGRAYHEDGGLPLPGTALEQVGKAGGRKTAALYAESHRKPALWQRPANLVAFSREGLSDLRGRRVAGQPVRGQLGYVQLKIWGYQLTVVGTPRRQPILPQFTHR